MFRVFTTWVLLATLAPSLLDAAEPNTKPHILMISESQGYVHKSVRREAGEFAAAELAMRQLADRTGKFTIECSQDAATDFTREKLEQVDIVMFYTSGDLPIAEKDLEYFFRDWLKQRGHGFIGVHSSSDTYKEYEPYWSMVGGTFNGHPWTQDQHVTISIHEPDHPTMRPFGKQFVIQDEIYQYSHWQPENVRVLMSLDMSQCETKRPWHVPVAWVKPWGEGRIYYNNLGHREETWQNKAFLDSLVEAVRWIDHQVEGDSTPNPEVSEAEQKAAIKAAGA